MSLRVLHIFSGDLWAGAEVMISNLLRELQQQRGIKLIALSLNEGELTRRLREAGVETHVVPETRYSFAGIIREAFLLLRKRPIDVIHSHRYKENLIALLLSRLIGVRRLISTLHGLPEAVAERSTVAAGLKRRVNFSLLKTFFLTVAVSDEMKNVLVKNYGFSADRVTRIYNGIPVPQLSAISGQPSVVSHQPSAVSLQPAASSRLSASSARPQPASSLSLNLGLPSDPQPQPVAGLNLNLSSETTFHIGTVGRMVPVKDFDLFLETAAEIRKTMQNVRFSILGDGPLKDHLGAKAKTLGLNGEMQFVDPQPDPLPYYRSLDLYMNTSVHEGIPLSILEAMSCGLPVVAPAVGGIPEIVVSGMHGYLIDDRRAESFADGCLTVLNDQGLRKEFCTHAVERVGTVFGSRAMSARYKDLYKALQPRKRV